MGRKYYPICPNCESNTFVTLTVYADGDWVGFECEGCWNVVRELYNSSAEAEEKETPDEPSERG